MVEKIESLWAQGGSEYSADKSEGIAVVINERMFQHSIRILKQFHSEMKRHRSDRLSPSAAPCKEKKKKKKDKGEKNNRRSRKLPPAIPWFDWERRISRSLPNVTRELPLMLEERGREREKRDALSRSRELMITACRSVYRISRRELENAVGLLEKINSPLLLCRLAFTIFCVHKRGNGQFSL